MQTIAVVNTETVPYGIFAGQETVNDICLDSSGQNIVMLSDLDGLMSVAKSAVQVSRGELQYNINKGVPYFQTIFQDANLLPVWKYFLTNTLSALNEVQSIDYLETKYDAEVSKLSYRAGISTNYGSGVLNGRYL